MSKTLYELTKPPEKDIKAFVINYLESKGYMYIRMNNARFTQKSKGGKKDGVQFLRVRESQKGAPDFFVFLKQYPEQDPFTIALETKRVGKDLSPDQQAWRERWEALGGEYLIVRVPEDLTGRL